MDEATSSTEDQAAMPAAPENSPEEPTTDQVPGLVSELLVQVCRQEGMTAQGFQSLREQLDLISNQLAQLGASATLQSAEAESPAPTSPVEEQTPVPPDAETTTADATPAELPPQAEAFVPQPVQPVREVHPIAAPMGNSELESLVFGQDLAYHESLASQRHELIQAVRRGDPAAIGLVGQFLMFRSATPEKMATQMKDIGEAWYRWQPDGNAASDPMRDALIAWLHARLDDAGLGNRVELVRVGDRYDSKKHNAKSRGVEVSHVGGWVVLRDSGSTYTKASVDVI